MALVAADLAAITAALAGAGMLTSGPEPAREVAITAAMHAALFGSVWLVVAYRLGTYHVPLRRNRRTAFRAMLETWATVWGVAGLLGTSILSRPPFHIWLVFGLGVAALAAVRLAALASPIAHASGRLRTLVIGASASARALISGRDVRRDMEFVGCVPFTGEEPAEMPQLAPIGAIGDLEQTLAGRHLDLALVCPSDRAVTGEVHRVFDACDAIGLGIRYFPPFLDLRHLRVGLSWTGSQTGLTFETEPSQTFAQLGKRAIDLVGATVGLAALLPVFLGCALAVRLTSPGPVFYRQTRVGRSGEHFTCFKFRTMRVGAHAQQEQLRGASTQDGPAFKIPKDPRVTPVGRLLRKFSLDELPQLLNVLIGDMSLVGPRPERPHFVERFLEEIPLYGKRLLVLPGVTGWAQVHRSYDSSVEDVIDKLRYDLFYVNHVSAKLDLLILLKTLDVVLFGRGAR